VVLTNSLPNYTNQRDEVIISKEQNNIIETERLNTESESTMSLITGLLDDVCIDLCDIYNFFNFGEGLQIKDFF